MLGTVTLESSTHPHLCSLRGCSLSSQVFVYIHCGVVVIATRRRALLTWLQNTHLSCRLFNMVPFKAFASIYCAMCRHKQGAWNLMWHMYQGLQLAVQCFCVCARARAGAWHLPLNSPFSLGFDAMCLMQPTVHHISCIFILINKYSFIV